MRIMYISYKKKIVIALTQLYPTISNVLHYMRNRLMYVSMSDNDQKRHALVCSHSIRRPTFPERIFTIALRLTAKLKEVNYRRGKCHTSAKYNKT